MRILIIDDDAESRDLLKTFLEWIGFDVDIACSGVEGLKAAPHMDLNLIILDVVLPDMSGLDICQRIRSFSDVPILMISAYAKQIEDVVGGLELGADDYLSKPLDFDLIQAKITAILRRCANTAGAPSGYEMYVDPHLMIDLRQQCICVAGKRISLSPLEYQLLDLLVRNRGQTIPMVEILEEVWPTSDGDTLEHTVRNYVKRLRDLIEHDPANPSYILNERGFGYKFDPE